MVALTTVLIVIGVLGWNGRERGCWSFSLVSYLHALHLSMGRIAHCTRHNLGRRPTHTKLEYMFCFIHASSKAVHSSAVLVHVTFCVRHGLVELVVYLRLRWTDRERQLRDETCQTRPPQTFVSSWVSLNPKP